MLKCSAIINEYYYVCREEIRVQSGKEKYGLTRDEAAAICMYTYYSKSITNILVQGNPGLYGCYMDHFINGFLKMWNYNRWSKSFLFAMGKDWVSRAYDSVYNNKDSIYYDPNKNK